MKPLPEEIKKEGLRWLEANADCQCSSKAGFYKAPRISSEYADCSMPLTFDTYSRCSLGCFYCVTGDTKISMLDGVKSIKNVKIGDQVLSYNTKTNRQELDEVTVVMSRETDFIYTVTLGNERSIKITGEHPIFVKDQGWVETKHVKLGSTILYNEPAGNVEHVLVTEIVPSKEVVTVYNISVKNNENYFANGMLVHNCFAYYFRTTNPAMKNCATSNELKPVNYKLFESILKGERKDDPAWVDFFSKRYILQWGAMSDPFCLFEKKNRVSEKLLQLFADLNYPTKLCFKGPVVEDYMPFFDKYKHQSNFAFQSSIISMDDELCHSIEAGVPSPHERCRLLGQLSSMGYWTIMRIRPFIIGMTDQTLDDLFENILKYKINAISTEFFCLDIRSNEHMNKRYDWMSEVLGYNVLDYYKKLSPTGRGGYRRLNRDVKERFIRKMYKFCYDNGVLFACSDPDFKELNMSGSCCGLPDKFDKNPEITNFSKCQLSNAIRLLRRDYWSGKPAMLTLQNLYGLDNVFGSYYHNHHWANESIETVTCSSGERRNATLAKNVKRFWNNLRSPKNPIRYFDGKVQVDGTDEQGNLRYVYKPSPYEYMWQQKFGIDLSRF